MAITSVYEFEHIYTVKERYYLRGRDQRVRRSVYAGDEFIATEDFPILSKRGAIKAVVSEIRNLEGSIDKDKCIGCRYRIGYYTGDIGYLLYLIIKTRIRIRVLRYKLRLFRFLKIEKLLKRKK